MRLRHRLEDQNRGKLVIQQNAPSIPYKDSTFGYEPLDESGKFLINVGNSFKESYQQQHNSTPGPGAYEIAQSYLTQKKNQSRVLRYDKDNSKRSQPERKALQPRVGPGSYSSNAMLIGCASGLRQDQSKISLLGHAAFASGTGEPAT